jgi:hypothetical protein
MAPMDDFNHILIANGAKQITDAGGLVELGAHGQLQGLGDRDSGLGLGTDSGAADAI